jgi:hypothetical protein
MDRMFYVQKEYIEDSSLIDGKIMFHMIKETVGRNCDKFKIISIDDLESNLECNERYIKKIIPVGNLEFIQKWVDLKYGAGIVKLTPIEVPEILRKFTNRTYRFFTGEELKKLDSKELNALFIKDADKLKNWNNLLYDGMDIKTYLNDKTKYVASQKINIISEYRVFVYVNVVMACQHYLGDVLEFPDIDTLHEMLDTYNELEKTDRPLAYTLDVAIMQDEDGVKHTVPLEVHPFVSCGLYGFYTDDILNMLELGYDWYTQGK